MIDFDDIDAWFPKLSAHLKPLHSDAVVQSLSTTPLEYVEDARDELLKGGRRDPIIDATIDWICLHSISGVHGTRLTAEDVASIRRDGLIPLAASQRRARLARALGRHPEWSRIEKDLDDVIQRMGPGKYAGGREGQVHLTLSLAGLTGSFNHYLRAGAEFDQHAAHILAGESSARYLESDGDPMVVTVSVPGKDALAAAHPYFTMEDRRRNGEVPNIANEFLEAYSFRLSRPGFQSRKLRLDCGMMFREAVPPQWIVAIEPWTQTTQPGA